MATALALKQFFLRLILCFTARYFPDGKLSNVNRGQSMEISNLQALLWMPWSIVSLGFGSSSFESYSANFFTDIKINPGLQPTVSGTSVFLQPYCTHYHLQTNMAKHLWSSHSFKWSSQTQSPHWRGAYPLDLKYLICTHYYIIIVG